MEPKPREKLTNDIDLVGGADASEVASGTTKLDKNQRDNQYGGYDYHFVASLSDGSDLVCKICQSPSRNPHLSSCCGHTFCKSCTDTLKESTVISYACPVCRDSEFSIVQNKQIDRAVRSLHVYCTNEKEGCKWQGEVNDIATHLKSCQFEGVKCENHGCEKIIQRQFVKSHMDFECPYRDVSCQYCYLIGSHYFIEGKHKHECPKFPLPCPNSCEIGTVPREDVNKHREICPLEMIECEYYDMGCEAKIARKDIKNHNKENVEEHLCMVKCELASTKKDLVQAEKDAMTAVKKMADLQNIFQKQIDDIETQGRENIKRLEIQLYNAICQLHKNYSPWGLKLDTLAATSTCGEQVVPVVIKMTEFTKMKREKEWWSSNPFYTPNKECKIQLSVFATYDTNRESTYLSVCLSLLEGPYDDEQRLPLKGKIELLNQTDDQEHHCVIVDCIVTKKNWTIFREPLFIAHSNLNPISSTRIFLKSDSLFFQVHMKTHSPVALEKLQQSILPSKEHATTDTTQSPTQQQEPSPQKEHFNAADDHDTELPMQQEKPHPHEEQVCVKKDITLTTRVRKGASPCILCTYIATFTHAGYI